MKMMTKSKRAEFPNNRKWGLRAELGIKTLLHEA